MNASASRAKWSELLHLAVDQTSDRPIFVQIYLALRTAIVTGTLAPGTKLPSSRDLAARLSVSRTSAFSAYEQLIAEGYAVGRGGSGTYVSDDVPPAIAGTAALKGDLRRAIAVRVSQAGDRYREVGAGLVTPARVPFVTGCCSVDAKTIEAWRRIGSHHMRSFDRTNLGYADPGGEPQLRREIAAYLRAARAVQCTEDQVIVLSGAQQAIDLSIRTLLDPGDKVWVEDPGYAATKQALKAAGATLVPVPLDTNGLDIGAARLAAPDARAAYITPSHQYPTGVVMSMARRLELLDWATKTGAWIIEDDYDSEFQYTGKPLASLQGLDRDGRVIYAGTLSKVLFPGLRLGFAVVPPPLIEMFRGARFLSDRSPPILQQVMTAEFMAQGCFTSHIRRMRSVYRQARDVLIEAVTETLGDLVDIEVPECGMQLIIHFRNQASDVAIADMARQHGLIVRPVSPLYLKARSRPGLVLGYSGFDEQQLRSAAAALGRIASPLLKQRPAGTTAFALPAAKSRRRFAGG
jgi:GntR family transcriptional regulator / MocR family aminotransferase